jgi:hypothetical protein
MAANKDTFLERLMGRTMSDIRIHSGGQAGDLARRLGARAFTVGRDIYVRPELVEPMTPEGEALLAHEMSHVMEQSGREAPDMPLLRPESGGASAHFGHSAGMPVQRAVDTAVPASLSGSEASAERVEGSARQSAQSSQSSSGQAPSTDAPQPPDAEEVADKVYRMMVDELVLDRERGAYL